MTLGATKMLARQEQNKYKEYERLKIHRMVVFLFLRLQNLVEF